MMGSVERIAAAVIVVPAIRQAADDIAQHAEALNVVDVVREAMQSVKHASPTDDAHIVMHTAQSEFRIRGERRRLQQAFVNLLNNGVEAARTAGRSPHIEVHIARTEDRKSVRISIRDNGRGMTPEQIRHVGQPFYSSKQAGSPNRGIGVFMTTRIVTLHRGAVRFRSDGEAFTLVEVTLPLLEMRSQTERDAS
jgi:signal transduction histidine kinase